MQMKEKEGQSRFVRVETPGDEFAVHLVVAKQDFYGFGPRPVDLVLADGFVAVAEVQTNESNELSEIALGGGLSQIRNGHGSLPLMRRVLANQMTRGLRMELLARIDLAVQALVEALRRLKQSSVGDKPYDIPHPVENRRTVSTDFEMCFHPYT